MLLLSVSHAIYTQHFFSTGKSFHFEVQEMPGYRPVWTCLQTKHKHRHRHRRSSCSEKTLLQLYQVDVHVLVTIPLGWKERLLQPLKNHPQYVFILHHADPPSPVTIAVAGQSSVIGTIEGASRDGDRGIGSVRDILTWDNSFLAGELASVSRRGLVPSHRTFTPSFMPIAARHPHPSSDLTISSFADKNNKLVHLSLACSASTGTSSGKNILPMLVPVPIAIIQGSLSSRRDLSELLAVLQAAGSDMHIKILTRHDPIDTWLRHSRWHVEWLQDLNMTAYHEAFQEASFLIAGMNPITHPDYFRGHPSSNIAYAVHYGLQIIGHQAIRAEYLALSDIPSLTVGDADTTTLTNAFEGLEGESESGFWHDGSSESIAAATRRAVTAWQRRCLT